MIIDQSTSDDPFLSLIYPVPIFLCSSLLAYLSHSLRNGAVLDITDFDLGNRGELVGTLSQITVASRPTTPKKIHYVHNASPPVKKDNAIRKGNSRNATERSKRPLHTTHDSINQPAGFPVPLGDHGASAGL